MEKAKIKLMADYQCFPIWGIDGNIDHKELPISDDLKESLTEWQAAYDKTLNQEDPINSGFASEKDALRFEEEGSKLRQLLYEQLDGNFLVSYYSELKDREILF